MTGVLYEENAKLCAEVRLAVKSRNPESFTSLISIIHTKCSCC
jgi:hypothetical protein